jgi:hypothetical protein
MPTLAKPSLTMDCPRCWKSKRDPVIAGPCSYCGGSGEAFNEQLSANFLLAEFTHDRTPVRLGIPNDPDATHRANLRRLVVELLQPLRSAVGPLHITSGYRTPAVNKAVGSKNPQSAHTFGLAADMDLSAPFGDVKRWLLASGRNWDQLLHEGTWLHLAVAHPDGRQRCLVQRYDPRTGKATPWL